MATLNISLPPSIRNFVEEQVADGGYATASEYLRELIRKAEKQAGREWLEAELLKGLNSGPGRAMTAKDWAEMRRRTREKIDAMRRRK